MAKYLKKFENHSAYEAAQSSLILPNVSLCVSEGDVHYNPYVDPSGGHDYVEIGGVKWATMNVGANSVTDTGLYFQWGDTQGYTADQVGSGEGQKYFGWEDYKYCNGSSSVMTKYNSNDGKTVLDASDDAVIANWGGNWRMPTTEEHAALSGAVTTAWTQIDGVYGMLCTDNTDDSKTLFFPVCGYGRDDSIIYGSMLGYSWSSSLDSSGVRNAYELYFRNDRAIWQLSNYRCYGFPVRGVLAE